MVDNNTPSAAEAPGAPGEVTGAPPYTFHPEPLRPGAYPPSPTSSPKIKRGLLIGGALVATLLVGIGLGSASSDKPAASAGARPAPTVTETMTLTNTIPGPEVTVTETRDVPGPEVTVTEGPPVAVSLDAIADGDTVIVGEDVPAGTYETHSDSTDCYWEIRKSAAAASAGDVNGIVANDLGAKGHLVVTLKKGQQFSSSDCGDWSMK